MRRTCVAAMIVLVGASLLPISIASQGRQRLNPMIELLEQGKPVFGLYAPRNARGGGGGRRGAAPPATPATPPPPQRTPAELAAEAFGYAKSDFVFDGSMEGGVERGLPSFTEFVMGAKDAGMLTRTPFLRLHHPLVVKMQEIAPDPAAAIAGIGHQLNAGVSGIMFVKVESAEEARQGIAAMRFKAHGGTRSDDVGMAPSIWGMTDAEYRRKADLWPLNPEGELINWTIVESREGLAHLDEIAAVPGIGVLWPGAGTLRGVFTATGADGERVFDAAGWEHAIQQVLAACKSHKIACGFPANENDIEARMAQGFNVFVMNWGDAGFRTIDIGRKLAGR